MLSHHDPSTVYLGGDRLFKSTTRGDTWTASPDLSRAIGRNDRPIMGVAGTAPMASKHDGAASFSNIVTIGESRPHIREALGSSVTLPEADDMSAAVRRAFASASPGQTVVLAPACASFDMFRDYAERGRVFKQEVRKLQDEWSTTREQ